MSRLRTPTGSTNAAHHLIKDQQNPVSVACVTDAAKITRNGGNRARCCPDNRLREEGHDGLGTEAEDLVLQCQRGPQAIGLGAFPGLPLAVFVAGRDMASQCKKRGKLCPSPCVPTGGQRPSMFP